MTCAQEDNAQNTINQDIITWNDIAQLRNGTVLAVGPNFRQQAEKLYLEAITVELGNETRGRFLEAGIGEDRFRPHKGGLSQGLYEVRTQVSNPNELPPVGVQQGGKVCRIVTPPFWLVKFHISPNGERVYRSRWVQVSQEPPPLQPAV